MIITVKSSWSAGIGSNFHCGC